MKFLLNKKDIIALNQEFDIGKLNNEDALKLNDKITILNTLIFWGVCIDLFLISLNIIIYVILI
jgi:hypothetical protein